MTILLGFLVMLALVALMAIGVIFGKKPIKGSCGGLSALGMKESCEICGGVDPCKNENTGTKKGTGASYYDATKTSNPN